MTKSFKKLHIIMVSIALAIVCGLFYCLTYYQKPASMQIATRNIEVSRNALDCQSVFDSFEDSKLEIIDNITSFEGVKTFNLTEFAELDLVSDTNSCETIEMKVKYAYTYDCETNLITLTVREVSADGTEIIDTLVGVAFVDENGELDAVFDCDGDYLLLSELQDLEQIQNCGWFKKALKKIKKVVSNPVGVIGAIGTVAIPAVIGVVCAVVAAPVVATIAVGAVVGAGIAAGTAAASTYIQDEKVDWEAVGICAGVGGAVGALASGVAYGVTSAIKGVGDVADDVANSTDDIAKGTTSSADDVVGSVTNSVDDVANTLPKTQYETSKLQHEWKHAKDFGIDGNWNKANGVKYQKAIQNHIDTATDVFKSSYRGDSVYVYINQETGIGAYVDMAGNYVGGWKFSAEQIAHHLTNGIKIL